MAQNINTDQKKADVVFREEKVLKLWKEHKTFEKSLEKKSPKGEFVFYEGPPTANGKPGIHHLEARAFKDAIPRYKTMRGYHVRRKGGWDTHGLPVELAVEKKLGLDSKKAIEEYGIDKFNQACKENVWEYVDLWEKFTDRIGYWVDQNDPYVTYHNSFIESLWNVIKKVNERGLLYKDYKVVPWCPRCGTVLSSHELAQGYEDVKDLSVYVKFKVKGEDNTYILAWTTTPWTLPGNVALAVGKGIDYIKVKSADKIYILAKERSSILADITEGYEVIEEMKGKDLIGLEYEPLYPYLTEIISEGERAKMEKAYKVYPASFVTTEDGTGVVHTAVMYGQDDFVLGTEIGLPKHHLVGLDGRFLSGTGIFEGRFVRDEEVAVDVIKDLAHRELLLKKEKYEHSYPHCWRCHTALIYYARDSWYIRMSDPKIREKLISENKKINWEPAHIREGRFGEWLREIKDWAISRERYWGTPLPVWICRSCKKTEVIGGIEELKEKNKESSNKYFVMRHGQADSNLKEYVASDIETLNNLTEKGKQEVKDGAEFLKDKKITVIISSDFPRTKQTAEIVADLIGFPKEKIIYDKSIRERFFGIADGKPLKEYYELLKSLKDLWNESLEGQESHASVMKRMGEFIKSLEKKYQGENILIVSHGDPIVSLYLASGVCEKSKEISQFSQFKYFRNGEARELRYFSLPRNEDFEIDLHRPYIDEVELVCDCGGTLKRTKEVMDVWFDSGAMPFAQHHYPFEEKDWVDGPGYPADFISEAIDQTRGWFYTLHAVGVLMDRGLAYKNVICLGHLLDANGKKMSKHVGNVVDPWEMIEKYGADTLRLWMYSVNQPGESKNFDEKTVSLLYRQVFGLLYNIFSFYELYRDNSIENNSRPKPSNALDKWIIARFDELVTLSTDNLDKYKLLEPVRAIRDFIDDLSTWYLRRSRERIKSGEKEAKQTLYYILKNLAKLMAPFAPFTAEDIWQELKNNEDEESVHLSSWPEVEKTILSIFTEKDSSVLEYMKKTRVIVSLGLEARQKAGIKVRQPLAKLSVKDYGLSEEYKELIKDELNVKEIKEDKTIETDVLLDEEITPALRAEGDYRELVRAVQDLRKKINLTPDEQVTLLLDTNEEGKRLIEKFRSELMSSVGASQIEFIENDGEEAKTGEHTFKIKITR